MTFRTIGCVAVLLLGALRGQDPAFQPLAQLAEYPAKGVSALYRPTTAALERAFKSEARWVALPRPITGVFLQPGQPPTFETSRGDRYHSQAPLSRWSAEQENSSGFRLVYDARVVHRSDAGLWIDTLAYSQRPDLLVDGTWTETRWVKGHRFARDRHGLMRLALDAKGDWWAAGTLGLYRLAGRAWKFVPIESVDPRQAAGVVAAPGGGIVGWSHELDSSGRVRLWRYDGDAWSTLELYQRRPWHRAAFRPDGSLILAGDAELLVVPKSVLDGTSPRIEGLATRLHAATSTDARLELVAHALRAPLRPARPPAAVRDPLKQEVHKTKEKLDAALETLGGRPGPPRDEAWRVLEGQLGELSALLAERVAKTIEPRIYEHLRQGDFPLGNGQWADVLGVLAISAKGDVVLKARTDTNADRRLLVLTARNQLQWLDDWDATNAQATPGPDGGFLLMSPDRGLWAWKGPSARIGRLAAADELVSGDRLLGCDDRGRVYWKRGAAIVMLLPSNARAARTTLARGPGISGDLKTVAMDSRGRVWWTRGKGELVSWALGESPLTPVPNAPRHARLLSPGRDGSMLVLHGHRGAALIRDSGVLHAETLLELARKHFATLLESAPRSTRDPRRWSGMKPTRFSMSVPWLAVGDTLWIANQERIYRVSAGQKYLDLQPVIEASGLRGKQNAFFGPLASGHLLLGRNQQGQLTTWVWAKDPGASLELTQVGSPPAEIPGGTLERPEAFHGESYLDERGTLWLHQGFDRTYAVDRPGTWRLLSHFGIPEFEHASGGVWAYHSARVLPGYELANGKSRGSCVYTYLNHVTPLLELERNRVVCLDPLGLTILALNPGRPFEASRTRSISLSWGGQPTAYIGRTPDIAVFIQNEEGRAHVAAVPLR